MRLSILDKFESHPSFEIIDVEAIFVERLLRGTAVDLGFQLDHLLFKLPVERKVVVARRGVSYVIRERASLDFAAVVTRLMIGLLVHQAGCGLKGRGVWA